MTIIKKIQAVRGRLLSWSTHSLILPVVRVLTKLPVFPYSEQELRLLPAGSLGRRLIHFLDGNALNLLADYEQHDIKHVLLGYPATELGEAAMQYFFLGNGQRSMPVLLTVGATMILMPEYYSHFRAAYRRGRNTPVLRGVNWVALLPLQAEDVLVKLGISQV